MNLKKIIGLINSYIKEKTKQVKMEVDFLIKGYYEEEIPSRVITGKKISSSMKSVLARKVISKRLQKKSGKKLLEKTQAVPKEKSQESFQEIIQEKQISKIKEEARRLSERRKYKESDLKSFIDNSYKQFLTYADQYGYVVLDEKKLKNLLFRMKVFKLITGDVFLNIINQIMSKKKQKIIKKKDELECIRNVAYFCELFLNELRSQLARGGGNSILAAKEKSYANTTRFPLNPTRRMGANFKLYIYSSTSPFLKSEGGMFYVKHFEDYSLFSVHNKDVVLTNRYTTGRYRVNALEYLKDDTRGKVVHNDLSKRAFLGTAFSYFARKYRHTAIWDKQYIKQLNRRLNTRFKFLLKREYLNSIGGYGVSVYRKRDLIGDFLKAFLIKHSSDPRFKNCVRVEYIKEELKVLFLPKHKKSVSVQR